MRFLLFASVLALFSAPVFADSRSDSKPVARVVSTGPRAARNLAATRSSNDNHKLDARQLGLVNFGFGATINICVRVSAATGVVPTSTSGVALAAIGANDCICVETSTQLGSTTGGLFNLLQTLSAPATVRVFVNGIQLSPASAVPIANSVLASTCTNVISPTNLVTLLLGSVLGTGGSCSALFANQQPAVATALVGTQICQTNSQTLNAGLLGVPIVSLANTIPIFNVAATDFNTRCCQRACNTGFVACGRQCVAIGTNCVSGVVQPAQRKRRDGSGAIQCPKGLTGCLVPGSRVYDCVDIKNDLESCGGCVDPAKPNAPGAGLDCTALTGVNDVECIRGTCQVRTCNKGFAMSANGTSCDPVAVFSGLKLNNKAGPDTLSKRKVVRSVIQA